MEPTTFTAAARGVLEAAWDDDRGYCYPNRDVYPHQWLWDSAFHAIAWASIDDRRGVRELTTSLSGQLPNGFVPHMRYARPEPIRGPLTDVSSYTQPPVYAHAARVLVERGFELPEEVVTRMRSGLDYLWTRRRTDDGLVFIVHPWEAGSDDSPRWDPWIGHSDWNRPEWTAFDLELVADTEFGSDGDARWSRRFVVAPSGFNALVAHAFGELAAVTGDGEARRRSEELAAGIDRLLWREELGMWGDRPIVGGGGDGGDTATLDGLLPALVTPDRGRARRALEALADQGRFRGDAGERFVTAGEPVFRACGYWRGSSWPQMNYLTWLVASRWGDADLAGLVRDAAIRGTMTSGFSEHWNADDGEACGATPQTWAAVVAAYAHPPVTP